MRKNNEIIESGCLWGMENSIIGNSALIKLPDCGTCTVVWDDNESGYEHVSVSPVKKFNIPSWNDMCIVKDVFFEDEEEIYQIHPKKSEYVNLQQNCLHLWKVKGHDLGELVETGA